MPGNNKPITPAIPAGLEGLYEATKAIRNDPKTAIDQPWSVTRLVVLDTIRMFQRLTGRTPRLIYLPLVVEVALQIDRARFQDIHEPLRQAELLYGCRPVWDSTEFRLE